jgi:hypothetical protein
MAVEKVAKPNDVVMETEVPSRVPGPVKIWIVT